VISRTWGPPPGNVFDASEAETAFPLGEFSGLSLRMWMLWFAENAISIPSGIQGGI